MEEGMTTPANLTLGDDEGVQIHGQAGVHTDVLFFKIVSIFWNYVYTTISVFGLVGNVLSTIALRRSGLHKSSNILLYSLAIADCLFLVGTFNFTDRLYDSGRLRGWRGPWEFGFAMFVLWHVHSCCYLIGHFLSMTIPALITTERLIAVYHPLKFPTIVTPRRTWLEVLVCFIFGLFYALFDCFTHLEYFHDFNPTYNASYGLKAYKQLSTEMWWVRFRLQRSVFAFQGLLPITYVTIGCILIGFKIRSTMKKRKELTATAETGGNRTNATLVSVCVLYVVCCGFYSFLRFMPPDPNFNRARSFENLFLTINSSGNFIIYVAVNRNLRATFKSVLMCRGSGSKAGG